MTREIDGFIIGPHTTNTIVAQRLTAPQHEYVFGLTPKGVDLHVIAPADAAGDPLKDARRFVNQATEAAKKYRDQLFDSADAAE